MKINTVSPGPNAHPQDPVAGDGSSPADRSIEIDAGHGSGTLGPRDGTQARACPQPASETTVRLGDLLSISSQRPSRPEVIPAVVPAGDDEGVPDLRPQPTRSGASQPRLANPGEARDVESGLLMRDCSSRIAAFLGNLSVVQELRQFDDSEFVDKLRNELVTEPGCREPKTLLAAMGEKVNELRSHLGKQASTPEETEFLAEARRYLEPVMASFETDIHTLQHDASAAKRIYQGALTLLLYPLPLATLFTQKTGTYAAFNIASYTYTAIQLVSLMRRPTTDAKLFMKHAINRHSLVFFISLIYAVPTFYAKAVPLQRNAGFVAGAAVAQGAMMFGVRLGQDLMDSVRLRFNGAFNRRRHLPDGFREAIEGVVGDLRAGLSNVNRSVGEFQQDRRITPHMDRQLTFFKQDLSRIVTGLERLVATGTQQKSPLAASDDPPGPLEAVRRTLEASFANNPDLKGKLALATVAFAVLGANIALMRNNGLALPDFIADAVVSSTFLLREALSPHVTHAGMNDSVSDTVGGMTIGLPFSVAAVMSGYMDDPRANPAGFIAGTVSYTAAYLLFGRVAGDVLSKGLMATSGALGWGQQQAIRVGRSAMALGFELVAGHGSPAAADVHDVVGVEIAGVPHEPLCFSPSQRASAERTLVGTLEQIGDEWCDARDEWDGESEGTAGRDDPWVDAPAELPMQPAPQSE
ncbi:type III effector [Xanthomonas vasicola]|uniref:type III secretion system effector XopAA n=1 Tax=Xanthomonas vasicola TaxID=56459 RepID=UPI0001CBFC22|nr:type III secretion system effector XopAA [Xanthomonas vasicola]MBV6746706.1 type III effector [Xanthomonas vasicola pv. vasculorum NCPPB 890]MBV6892898.1 type III effector [Xanthomonas vasicola pv. vasculorum]MDO6947768.1 type III secretion system effector XopAA [Xanthomonas vasicola]MDO6959954.1 type III secretion system effector XopAA [Xanthomonas vasicola]MDO6969438.1 type III secretion system effector XopAA [Xanthomonas vasicola]